MNLRQKHTLATATKYQLCRLGQQLVNSLLGQFLRILRRFPLLSLQAALITD